MLTVTLPTTKRTIGVRFVTRVHNIREEAIEGTVRVRRLPANPKYRGKASMCPIMRQTTCEIVEPGENGGKVLTSATVTLNPQDRHIKRVAQRNALTMALNYATGLGITNKADREAVWQAWWLRGKKPATTVLDVNGNVMYE